MILRSTRYEMLLIFSYLFLESTIAADTAFNCLVTIPSDDTKFDLTDLAGEHVVHRKRETPPSFMIDSLRFDLCAELKPQDGVAEHDQCPSGTRACLTKTNQKPNEPDRIVGVVPVAQTSTLNPILSASLSPKYLSLLFHGAEYPLSVNSTPVQQTLNLTLFCDPQATSEPKIMAYDGSRLDLEWSAPAGCPSKEEGDEDSDKGDDKKGDGQKENVGSGIGWFFLVILLAFAAYLGLGAYYNYSTYGATGLDLIPHRDFWKEVPYMLSDVVSHLCSTLRRSTLSHDFRRIGYDLITILDVRASVQMV